MLEAGLLKEVYQKDPVASQILAQLSKNNGKSILIKGLSGSRGSFLLFGTYYLSNKTSLIIANDKEEASYIYNDLSNFVPIKNLFFFPDSFKRPANFESLNTFQVQQRLECIDGLSLNPNSIFITYPEAIFEKVIPPLEIAQSKIEIAKDDLLDIDELIDKLIHYGFQRVDFVYEPGQYSIRGGIIDLYSFSAPDPYRIELNDIVVESIRTFDTGTQLSVLNIGKFSIIPNINSDIEHSEKRSFLEVMPKDSIIWIKELDVIKERMNVCLESAMRFSDKMVHYNEEEQNSIIQERAFLNPYDLAEQLQNANKIFFHTRPANVDELIEIEVHSKPQPSINKNFNLLIEQLKLFQDKKYKTIICSENKQQIERLFNIFEDLKAGEVFTPQYIGLHEGFIDEDLKIACFTDHQIFSRYHGIKAKQGLNSEKATNLKLLRELQPGDYVTHLDHGVGRFAGLEKLNINDQLQEVVRLIYKGNDILYVSIHSLHKISKFVGQEGTEPTLHKLGSEQWKALKNRTKQRVKDIAKELIALYAKRKASKGFSFSPDNYMQTELEASFIYEDTPDQIKVTQEVKNDMEQDYPMDRLICGDVGFGKTEIAIRAAFKCVQDGKQVAILVPTTILALQHYKTFKDRLKEFPVDIDYVSRFRTTKEKTQILKNALSGKLDILIGTHSLLNKKTQFKDLGLLIIDEEQKFGVASKEKLRELKVNVDTLTLTATPIPRTLQFSLMSARDLSIIQTPPPNRQPIATERRVFNDELIKQSILSEVYRGGQVFFVHNRVANLGELAEMIRKLCPNVDVAVAHGQLDAEKLEKILVDFIEFKYDVLVCTNIIETGLDIPNANTIIINNAHQFGLSDLHQLRGRVGRSNRKAYCYLFAPPSSALTLEAKKRLKTLEEFSDLGSGFAIAMKDLDIRGAGNLLGGEQSGFITDIGYEAYQRILEEAIIELKESDFKDVFEAQDGKEKVSNFVRDVGIDTDIEMYIPDSYVSNIQERLSLYQQLDKIENEEGVNKFKETLKDRFGQIPIQVEELFEGLRVRWLAKQMGLEKIILKKKKLQTLFISNPKSSYYDSKYFKHLTLTIQNEAENNRFILKQTLNNLMLVKEQVKTLSEVLQNLEALHAKVSLSMKGV
ncbi:MAG: transcription-repair coupling factor [Saprospiraceae bacterium]|nr:transcription-repair coupling factor [Saprospiraceae bacterium]